MKAILTVLLTAGDLHDIAAEEVLHPVAPRLSCDSSCRGATRADVATEFRAEPHLAMWVPAKP